MKRSTTFAAILAIVALMAGLARPGSAASTVTQNFLLTAAGDTPVLAFSGQLQCEVQIYGPNAAIASTPQYSANSATWAAASNINSGSITQPGAFIGTNPAGTGYTSFRLHVSSFSGLQLSGQLICGDSLPASATGATGPSGAPGSPGPSGPPGSPGPVSTATPAAGNCIVITTPPPNGTIAVQGAGCTPSPGDAGQISCTISGTTCTATATVGAGETCVVTYDATATTVPIADLLPLVASVTSTTLTATGNTSAGSGDTYFDYLCF